MIWEIDLVYFFKNNNIHKLKQEIYIVIIDRFSRYCLLCENVTNNQTASNFINIFKKLLTKNPNHPHILHSDFGTQFSSKAWQEFAMELKINYNINLSLSNKKAYNTYAVNIFMNSCRSNYWNKYALILTKNSSTEDINFLVNKSIKEYNNSRLNMFNKFTKSIKTNNTPFSIYNDLSFNNITPILVEKAKYPYKTEQKYIDLIIYSIKNNLKLDYIPYHPLKIDFRKIAEDVLINLNKLKKSNNLEKKYKIKKQKRDIIEMSTIYNILSLKDIYITKSNCINKLKNHRVIQLKIGIILLYLTGCRVGEVEQITFKAINNLLKNGYISILVPKDKTTREIPIKNTKLLLNLDFLYKELINLYKSTNVYFDETSPIFHKLKSYKSFYIVESAKYGYLKNLINAFLTNYMICNNIQKAWSTHSFRHTVITKLIDKQGIINTKLFIGHKDTKTTELYYHAKKTNKILIESAKLL